MNSNNQKLMMMRDEKIPKVLLKLGVPTMIGMMVSALYSVVDAYFVGWLGTSQMGAVSIVFPIVQIIVGLGMTFGSGAASYISRLLGEGKPDEANRTASTALFSSLFVGIVCHYDCHVLSRQYTCWVRRYRDHFPVCERICRNICDRRYPEHI